jgi:hypothetical protein
MKIIWVATTGADTTGTGAQAAPYATIERALQDFESGDQIRILDGTYIPTDSIIISGMDGSIFAENPQEVYIQPQKTKNSQACVAIMDASRFSVTGINIIQAADSGGNLIGLYVENVENFIAYTCSVSGFEVPSGDAYGIFAAGGGRIEHCQVNNIAGAGDGAAVYGIRTVGIDVIDCSVVALSGVSGRCRIVQGIDYDGLKS